MNNHRSIDNSLKYSVLFLVILVGFSCAGKKNPCATLDHCADIFPDYVDVVIPPNIAPLNFHINTKGDRFRVECYTPADKGFAIEQSSPDIILPEREWHKLIGKNKGSKLLIDIYVKEGNWVKFKTISDSIVSEEVEPYLAYRLINSVNIIWNEMGIYQRNVENYTETPIFRNRSSGNGCVNCHQFNKANPEQMTLHLRKSFPGTLILLGDSLFKFDTGTKNTLSAFAYPAWHPDGNHLAYSVNLIHQIFTSMVNYHDVVYDDASDIVIYNLQKNTVTTSPRVSSPNRENMPAFSPDGKWLYYISAPPPTTDSSRIFAKYSLVRIPVNVKTNSWGNVDTLISSNETGKSISFPRVSPDGRFVMFSMCNYGYFSIFDKDADLYCYDLEKRTYHKLESNSAFTESYHTWSQTGRWFTFTSRRIDNLYSRPFYAYFDKNGKAYKPFVLPQKDPLYYRKMMKNYNLPELIGGKVKVDEKKLRDFIRKDPTVVTFDATSGVDALSGETTLHEN